MFKKTALFSQEGIPNGTSQSPKHVAQSIHLGVLSPKRTGAPQNSWVLLFNLQPSGVEKSYLPLGWKTTMTNHISKVVKLTVDFKS